MTATRRSSSASVLGRMSEITTEYTTNNVLQSIFHITRAGLRANILVSNLLNEIIDFIDNLISFKKSKNIRS